MKTKRTPKQNSSLHLYCKILMEVLNEAGLDQRVVLKPEVDIPWTLKAVKEKLWKPIQEVVLDKESTTELNTDEVSKVYDVLHRHLVDKFGAVTEFPQFPSEESRIDYDK